MSRPMASVAMSSAVIVVTVPGRPLAAVLGATRWTSDASSALLPLISTIWPGAVSARSSPATALPCSAKANNTAGERARTRRLVLGRAEAGERCGRGIMRVGSKAVNARSLQ